MVSRPLVRHDAVQAGTGASVSTVAAGAWYRGQVIRTVSTPSVQPPGTWTMYDPTDPATWGPASNRRTRP